jgi:hypothetical protein
MIPTAVNLLVLTQHILRTSYHAEAAAFAFFIVDHYRPNNFCHDLFFIDDIVIPGTELVVTKLAELKPQTCNKSCEIRFYEAPL